MLIAPKGLSKPLGRNPEDAARSGPAWVAIVLTGLCPCVDTRTTKGVFDDRFRVVEEILRKHPLQVVGFRPGDLIERLAG